MKRRTLDLLFSAGGILFGVLLLVLGLVLNNQANFAKTYVANQLTQQKITFTPAEALKGEDKAPGGQCLANYGGSALDSGKKAECYANQYIGFHLAEAAKTAKVEGATYATLGTEVAKAKTAAADAKTAGSDTTALDARVTELSGLRDTMFKGETLRGLLLTSYGFSIFGDRAGMAADVMFALATLMFVLSIAGFIHAFTSKKRNDDVAVPQPQAKQPELVGV